MRQASSRSQRGAVIITVCLLLLFLLGFIGIALDFGRLFIVKSELQTAMDSCALAAAQELDLQPTAIDRARSAGMTAGNLNAVNLQSANWSGKGQITTADITFKDSFYVSPATPETAQYVECRHVQPAVQLWLLQALGAFSGNSTLFPNKHDVMASAVATRAHGQTTCPIPVAMKPKAGGVHPDYGYTVGEWVPMITNQPDFSGGHIGWMSLVLNQHGTDKLVEQMNGFCGTTIGTKLQQSDDGNKTALVEPWNYRFGLYAKKPDFTDPVNTYLRPDLTGYAYSLENSSGSNVYDDFVSRRTANAACGATVSACAAVGNPDWKFPPGQFGYIMPPGGTSIPGSHGAEGTNRRLVIVPVIKGDGSNLVDGFACMLMLQPLSIPLVEVQFEYLGNAKSLTSPCSFSGMPGGAAGPLVPALVR